MKPAVDEMFPEGAGPYVDLDEAGGSTGLLMDLAANEKAVHADFFNGKDAGWAASFSPCFLCKGCRGAVLGRERLGPQARQAQVPCPSGNSAQSPSSGQLCVKRRSSCSQVPSVGSEPYARVQTPEMLAGSFRLATSPAPAPRWPVCFPLPICHSSRPLGCLWQGQPPSCSFLLASGPAAMPPRPVPGTQCSCTK
uniref:COP9 signalosome complex subunit 9 n=1 Tax=Sus scrofa TaxID=9823 RepID=A0A8D0X274_PIG